LPARNLIALPERVTDRQAVFVEPLAAALGVLERCPIEPGQRVAVIGDGKLGLLCAMALHAAGHAPVLIGKHPSKLALANGVDSCVVDNHPGRVFDVVVEASGGPSGFALALALLVPQGRLVLKSTFHGETPIDAARIVVEEVTVIGSRCGRFAPAIAALVRGGIDVERLVSETWSIDRAEHAMGRAASPGVVKVLLER
jgi:threonine dehydrogenase-like Zn-dependent dehydrogenase